MDQLMIMVLFRKFVMQKMYHDFQETFLEEKVFLIKSCLFWLKLTIILPEVLSKKCGSLNQIGQFFVK